MPSYGWATRLNRLIEAGIVRPGDGAWPPLYIADELLEVLEGPVEIADA